LKEAVMPKFVDFHPGHQMTEEAVERLRNLVVDKVVDEFGVRQLEFLYGEDGAYCILEAPDEEAVCKHHGGPMGDVHEIKTLL
jgi:hypothetical protein